MRTKLSYLELCEVFFGLGFNIGVLISVSSKVLFCEKQVFDLKLFILILARLGYDIEIFIG